MHIKSQIRRLLSGLLVEHPIVKARDQVTNKQAIQHIILDQKQLPNGLQHLMLGNSIRILATDLENANSIARVIKDNHNLLGVESIHIYEGKTPEYNHAPGKDPVYRNSVLLNINRKSLLKSTIQPFETTVKKQLTTDLLNGLSNQNVVIDFSSPNIAKPFHFGHLKSTILGNFLANLNKFVGNKVTKLNYIGDWGTQYGLLSLGLSTFGEGITFDDSGNKSLLRQLVDVYVQANERGSQDEAFFAEAKRLSLMMEKDPNQISQWQHIRDLSLNELIKSYSTIGIEFDTFEFESEYSRTTSDIINRLKEHKFVRQLDDGVIVADIDKNYRMLEIPVQRSDGASLYLTRDVAAAISRKEKYNFDRMLYVVGLDQDRHFYCLKEIIKYLGYDWHQSLKHVGIGKVAGMSTRSGEFVLLSDIIEETTRQYIEFTKKTPTSKVKSEEDIEIVGSQLALSALFVSDMRNYRTKNYQFGWTAVMNPGDRSGINLQTTYARLSSLIRKASESNIKPAFGDELDIDALCCVDSSILLSNLNELDTALYASYWQMDSSPLVNYALKLCKSINRARRSEMLKVIDEPDLAKSRTRLALFGLAHDQLKFIIEMIGLKPLDRV